MAKNSKIEKETRQLIESISDLVKKKGDRYKFKSKKKKLVKKVRKTCVHWVIRKGKPVPTVVRDEANPSCWRCAICGATFPIKPLQSENGVNAYQSKVDEMLGLVNQIQFYSVKLGGDAEDTKTLLKLKQLLPKYAKMSRNIIKHINKREEFENQKKRQDSMSQFSAYSGFNYR